MSRRASSIAETIAFLRTMPKLDIGSLVPSKEPARLRQADKFGFNPGNLRMLFFVPEKHSKPMALVVVLHGCAQSSAGYDAGAGWSELAERYGFALLMPEQRPANNPNGCFNWFQPDDISRDKGEALSIRSMISQLSREQEIDPNRVFITGLSAGGAMTSVMLATYPEVFCGGAIIAGLPYGVANNVQTALSEMRQPSAFTSKQLGDFVRKASTHRGSWPKISVWHGSDDHTVSVRNAAQIVSQWNNVHKSDAKTIFEDVVDGHPRQSWLDKSGNVAVESYTIKNMPHGTPLGNGANGEHFGTEGAYLIECGISSSYHIARFFGLTEKVYSPASTKSQKATNKLNETSPLDIGSVISRALTAARLLK